MTNTAALATFAGPAAADDTSTLEFSGTFTGIGTPDWHYLPLEVPEGVRAIAVSYDAAATSTGLGFSVNVVDIGIFDTDGFRGWSGGARVRAEPRSPAGGRHRTRLVPRRPAPTPCTPTEATPRPA